MRCRSCNVILDLVEERRTYVESGEPLDLCDICLGSVREDINTEDGESYFDVEPFDDDGHGEEY